MKVLQTLTYALAAGLAVGLPWLVGACDAGAGDDGARLGRDDDVRSIARRLAEKDADLPGAVRNWYASPELPLLWTSPDSDRSRSLREALDRAGQEGLSAEELGRDALLEHLDRLDADRHPDSVRAEAELALSTAFLRMAKLHARGSDLREKEDVTWDMQRDPEPGIEVLFTASRGSPREAIDSVRPILPLYARTAEAFTELRARAEAGRGWPRVDVDAVAEPGDSAEVVQQVRSRLGESIVERERELAERNADRPRRLDGDLALAIAHFQRRHGIAVDSVIGRETVAAMNIPLEQRVEQLRLNLDRLRWLPRDMGERAILVNVAGFELRVLENNRPVMNMGVVVGLPSWRTAVFQDTMEYLVVNPWWHVPETIEADEMLPKVKEDPGYLAANDISVVPEDDNFGDPVDAGSIDWSAMTADRMPYDFRQEPGPQNSLGQIKFIFPNEHAIYLHDTPAGELFDENFRAFSHGCVRVERPWELAEYILSTASDHTPAELADVRASKERTRLDLEDPLPVYVAYLTTWVHEDGTVSFHQDLYGRDEAAYPKLSAREVD